MNEFGWILIHITMTNNLDLLIEMRKNINIYSSTLYVCVYIYMIEMEVHNVCNY